MKVRSPKNSNYDNIAMQSKPLKAYLLAKNLNRARWDLDQLPYLRNSPDAKNETCRIKYAIIPGIRSIFDDPEAARIEQLIHDGMFDFFDILYSENFIETIRTVRLRPM